MITLLICCSLEAQEFTFEKQREQALFVFHQNGTGLLMATCETRNGTPITDYQLSAVAAVMAEKDGYVKLMRKSNTEVVVVYASFIPETDLRSVFRHVGVLVVVRDTQATGVEQLEAQ